MELNVFIVLKHLNTNARYYLIASIEQFLKFEKIVS